MNAYNNKENLICEVFKISNLPFKHAFVTDSYRIRSISHSNSSSVFFIYRPPIVLYRYFAILIRLVS
jgi:hypothetical protein